MMRYPESGTARRLPNLTWLPCWFQREVLAYVLVLINAYADLEGAIGLAVFREFE